MQNFLDTFETSKRSFMSAFSICMTVPLNLRKKKWLAVSVCKPIAQKAIYFLKWLFQIIDTAQKAIFSFSRRPEKMVFPKKLRWNMIFLVLSWKVIFLFPENMILPLVRKMKDDLFQENTRKYISFKCSE